MNALIANLASSGKNLHVSIPILLALGCEAGKIWMPSHLTQWDATQKVLLGYGIISAGNSAPQPPKP